MRNEPTTMEEGLRDGPGRDKESGSGPGDGKGRGRKRRKVSYLTINKIDYVDYKDFNVLRRFLNDRGKILGSRQTGNTANQQRMIARAIRRARELALLPFVVTEMSGDRRDYPPRERRPRHDHAERAEQAAERPAEQPAEAPVAVGAGGEAIEAAPKPKKAHKAEAAPVEAPAAEAPGPEPAAESAEA